MPGAYRSMHTQHRSQVLTDGVARTHRSARRSDRDTGGAHPARSCAATRSPIMITVSLLFPRTMKGMIDASAT